MSEAMVLTVLNLMLEGMKLWRVVGGNTKELTDLLEKASEEDRDFTPEEIATLRARAVDAVNRL